MKITLSLRDLTIVITTCLTIAAIASFSHFDKEDLLPDALAGFNTNTLWGDFNSYQTWTNSTTLKADDTMVQTLYKIAASGSTKYDFIDINGDGLVDLLFHDVSTIPMNFGVYLNNGNLGFTWAYKCAVKTSTSTYYGDCAG